jgi:copper resistance protein C
VIFLDGGSATGAYRFSVGTGMPPAPLSFAARQTATAAVTQHVHQVDEASAVLFVIDGAVAVIVLFLLWTRPHGGRRDAGAWRVPR